MTALLTIFNTGSESASPFTKAGNTPIRPCLALSFEVIACEPTLLEPQRKGLQTGEPDAGGTVHGYPQPGYKGEVPRWLLSASSSITPFQLSTRIHTASLSNLYPFLFIAMKVSVSTLAFFAAIGSSAVLPRADNSTSTSTACHSVHTGYLTVFPGDQPSKHIPVGLNSQNQVTYGVEADQKFLVEFQACPSLPDQAPNLDMWNGRIIKSGSTDCVTVSNPSAPEDGPFFLELAACQSDTEPPASQQWEYGNDFGAVVFWKGASENDEVGWTDDDQSNPAVEQGTNRLELGCAKTCSSFNITPENEL